MSVDPPGTRARTSPSTASRRSKARSGPRSAEASNTSLGCVTTWVKKRSSIRSRAAVVGTTAPSASLTRSHRCPPMLPEPSTRKTTSMG